MATPHVNPGWISEYLQKALQQTATIRHISQKTTLYILQIVHASAQCHRRIIVMLNHTRITTLKHD